MSLLTILKNITKSDTIKQEIIKKGYINFTFATDKFNKNKYLKFTEVDEGLQTVTNIEITKKILVVDGSITLQKNKNEKLIPSLLIKNVSFIHKKTSNYESYVSPRLDSLYNNTNKNNTNLDGKALKNKICGKVENYTDNHINTNSPFENN